MSKLTSLFAMLLLALGLAWGAPPDGNVKTFVGSISDSMCGAKHMMPGETDKQCTLDCVKNGSKYVFVDSTGKVYQLTDQKKPEAFAGAKVKITGTVSGDTIADTSITAAK